MPIRSKTLSATSALVGIATVMTVGAQSAGVNSTVVKQAVAEPSPTCIQAIEDAWYMHGLVSRIEQIPARMMPPKAEIALAVATPVARTYIDWQKRVDCARYTDWFLNQ